MHHVSRSNRIPVIISGNSIFIPVIVKPVIRLILNQPYNSLTQIRKLSFILFSCKKYLQAIIARNNRNIRSTGKCRISCQRITGEIKFIHFPLCKDQWFCCSSHQYDTLHLMKKLRIVFPGSIKICHGTRHQNFQLPGIFFCHLGKIMCRFPFGFSRCRSTFVNTQLVMPNFLYKLLCIFVNLLQRIVPISCRHSQNLCFQIPQKIQQCQSIIYITPVNSKRTVTIMNYFSHTILLLSLLKQNPLSFINFDANQFSCFYPQFHPVTVK